MNLYRILITASLLLMEFSASLAAQSLEQSFQSPPASARPYAWWHWLNGNVSSNGITKDLEAMKALGIGGFHQFDAGLAFPEGPVLYNTKPFHDLMAFAFAEADRLGLEAGFNACSGWSSTGGPWITPENSMKALVWSEQSIHSGETEPVLLSQPQIKNDQQIGKNPKKYDFYRDVAVLAFPTPKNGTYRITDWQHKALSSQNTRADTFVPDFKPAPSDAVISADKIVNLSDRMDAHGRVNWVPPAGDWTIVRFGYTTTGTENHPGSKAGTGLEVDKLSRKALDVHWHALIDKIIADAKGTRSLSSILIDSYEVGMQNWTDDLPREFQKRRGYDLIPFLLCMTGRAVDDTETTERALWDLRTTVSELMHENYFGYFAEKCHEHGLKFALEPYGNGTFDAAAAAFTADIPMTEFWQEPRSLWQWTAQVIPSAARLSGQAIVGAEAFTAMDGNWKDSPSSLKQVGDWAFAKGVNRYYFHTTIHQPWNDAVQPGMTFSRFGGNFHRNNTWYLKSRAWMDYIARCQFLLQTGTYQADVLALYGDERGFNNFIDPKESLDVATPAGVNCDLGGMSSLDNLSVDSNGDIRVTWKGKLLDTRYKLLLLKRADLMLPAHVAKLGELADQGAKIYAPKPHRSPSLSDHMQADKTLQKLAKRYWDSDLIHPPAEFAAAVAALTPDCELPDGMLFNRHHHGEDDFYFISNQKTEAREITAKFRVSGKQPEIWNPITGEITKAANWKTLDDGRTEVSLSLTPVDSLFVVFREPTSSKGKITSKPQYDQLLNLNDQWTVTFDPHWGPKEPVAFDRLTPWNESTNEEIKYFSGTAVYKTSFELKNVDSRLFLDLGRVEVLARVRLNGKELGTLWKPPFRVEISQAAKAGANTLEVEITDLWVNRLIGDERFPEFNRAKLEWLRAGQAPPADAPRKTFLIFKRWKKADPLVPSGLLGPVIIEQAKTAP